MNTSLDASHTNAAGADHRFIAITIVLAMVLSVAGIMGLGTLLGGLGEGVDGTAFADYVAEVGEVLGY